MRSFKLALSVAVLSSSVLLFQGCSKKEETPAASGPSILDSEIVSYLPATSVGFFTWNTESEGYKKLKSSVWSQNASKSLELLKNLEDNPDAKRIIPIIDSLVQTGLVPKSPSQPDVINSGVGFIDIDKAAKLPTVAIYMSAASGQDLSSKIPTLESAISAQGFATQKETIGGVQGFSVQVGDKGNPFEKFYVAYSKDKLALASSIPLAETLFNGKPSAGIQQIKQSEEFKKAAGGVTNPAESMSFAYFDMNKFISTVASLGLSPEQDPSTELKEIPVQSLALTSSMKDNLSYSVAVSLNPKNENQKRVISALSGAGGSDILNKVPSDLMLLLSLDGKTISSIKNAMLTEIPAEALGPMGEQLKLLDSLKSLSLGLRGPAGATPFPELVLVAESSESDALHKLVKSQLDMALASSGMPMPWQQKEIGGAQVTYALSPFGVGAYVTSNKGMVIVASGEKLISDLVTPSNGTLLAGMSNSTKEMLSSSKPFIVAYSDFNKIANALSSTQDQLAMFTGGKGGISPEQLAQMRQVGTVVLSLNVDDNLVKLRSTYEIPPKG
ncbi:MAG: hypothetical protein J5J00_06195 [Deltaproteobacteria bacterium]|nr:hypothetical protein [Deltaproteobacteria bacterium]